MSGPGSEAPGSGLDWFRTSVFLFLGLRLALMVALPADALFRYGDFQHYYDMAAWSMPGHCPTGPGACWPLVDYWYEFPPLFGLLAAGLMRLWGGALPPFHAFAYALAAILVAADFGNLLLLRSVARRLYPAATADWIVLVYAGLPAPLILTWWTFDGLTTFWMMLGLWALLEQRDGWGALAIGLGVLTKLLPALLLPAVWRARPPRRAALVTAGALVVVALGVAPFLARAPAMALASLRSQFAKSSYGTVWAVLDGNLQAADGQPVTGNFGPLSDRFDPANATRPQHNAAVVPGWLTLAAAALLFGWAWQATWRGRAPWDARQTVRLAGLTWAVFLLWSRGWSPQWQQMLVPFILLTLPNRQGVLLALALAAVSFLEWPVLLSRGLAWGYNLTIPLRAGLVLAWGAYLVRALLPAPASLPVKAPA